MSIRAALVQTTSGRDVKANVATCRTLARAAANDGADWILFPENASFLGADRERDAVAEPIDGPTVGAYRKMATDLKVWITLGGFPERYDGPEDGGNNYNTQLLITPDGEVAATYRKMHLFDARVDSETAYCESDYVRAGDEVVTARVKMAGVALTVGLSTCYDLRFPELYRVLTNRGSTVITVPSAFTLQTGRDHWHPLLQARAIENQVYVLAPDQFGHHFGKRWSYGHSTAYDPWGTCLVDAPDRECYTIAQIDLEYLERIRQRMPVSSHRRDLLRGEPEA